MEHQPAATIRDYLNQHLGTALTQADALPFVTTSKQVAKGAIITAYGQVEAHAYFLRSGTVQLCVLRHGQEKISDFMFAGEFFCAYSSLLTQQPADVEITALTACTVEVLRRAELLRAYQTSLLANQLGRYVTEQLFLRKVKREKDFLSRSAEERYADLLQQQPALVSRLPVDKVARYLGVHPSSLSRIRRKLGRGFAA